MIKQLLNFCTKLVNFISDNSCAICGFAALNPQTCLCHHCTSQLAEKKGLCCQRCGLAAPLTEARLDEGPARCGGCLNKQWVVCQTVCVGPYDWPLNSWVLALKHHQKLHYGRILGQLLAEALMVKNCRADIIIPMPLHVARLRERGFNQASEIAIPIAKRLQIPIGWNIATRIENTQSQAKLNAKQRYANVKHAFASKPLAAISVAIVDDVVTTGATSQQLAQTLLLAGAREVQLWCVARVSGQDNRELI